jgi:uncharacterized membrane protein YobD (UPF0266 family)
MIHKTILLILIFLCFETRKQVRLNELTIFHFFIYFISCILCIFRPKGIWFHCWRDKKRCVIFFGTISLIKYKKMGLNNNPIISFTLLVCLLSSCCWNVNWQTHKNLSLYCTDIAMIKNAALHFSKKGKWKSRYKAKIINLF